MYWRFRKVRSATVAVITAVNEVGGAMGEE
jgi:hypothetical protein